TPVPKLLSQALYPFVAPMALLYIGSGYKWFIESPP
ncbi:hypothetical protein TNCT_460981, partial [Trichonephila clavata]